LPGAAQRASAHPRAHVPAFLDDYAFLVEGLLELHGATGDRRWLDEAARLAAVNKVPGGGSLQGYIRTQLSTNELRNGGSSWVPLPAQVCISFPNGTSNVGDPVKVELTAGYHWLPFIASDIGVATSSIVGSSTMRLEQKPTNYAAGCA